MEKFVKFVDDYNEATVSQLNSQPSKELNEALALNDKLVSVLEKAETEIDTLKKETDKILTEKKTFEENVNKTIQQLQSKINEYSLKEQAEQKAKFNEKLTNITQKWCDVFSVSDSLKREEARNMLSAFSMDKLAEVETFLSHKMTQMAAIPKPLTKSSQELEKEVVSKPIQVAKSVSAMTPQEKKEYTEKLYQQMLRLNK